MPDERVVQSGMAGGMRNGGKKSRCGGKQMIGILREEGNGPRFRILTLLATGNSKRRKFK
jgi:hypothetical protein